MKTICLIIFHVLSSLFIVAQTGTITNIAVLQRTDGSGLVDIHFDLSGGATAYNLVLEASLDGGSTYVPIYGNHVTGDKEQVAPGTLKHVIWNAQESFPNTYSPKAMIKIIATPGQTGTASQPCPGMPVFTDTRDGKTYHTVQIGKQCWMAQNLAYLPSVVEPLTTSLTTPYHYVYDYWGTNTLEACSTTNYQTYGVLYNWPAALQACPVGWHLPTDVEWFELENYLIANGYNYDGTTSGNKIAKSLAAASGWFVDNGMGTVGNTDYPVKRNTTGFTALPGGFCIDDGPFLYAGSGTGWWSASELSSLLTWGRALHSYHNVLYRSNLYNHTGLSVRCIRD